MPVLGSLLTLHFLGANVPGKVVEQLNYPGGFPLYYKETREVLDQGFKGFDTEPPKA